MRRDRRRSDIFAGAAPRISRARTTAAASIPPRLAENLFAERSGFLAGAAFVQRLGAQRHEAAPLARGGGRPGGDELLQDRGVELRLEGVERDAEGAAGDGAALPLQEREEELQRAEPVALLEFQARGGEARRHVEEIVGRDVALEERQRRVRCPVAARARAER